MVKCRIVHLSPNGKEKEPIKPGVYLYPYHRETNGIEKCAGSSLDDFSKQLGCSVLPLGSYSFDNREQMKEILNYSCRFSAPERRVVEPPATTHLDLPETERDSCIELRASSLRVVSSVTPVSRSEAREIVFSVASSLSEREK